MAIFVANWSGYIPAAPEPSTQVDPGSVQKGWSEAVSNKGSKTLTFLWKMFFFLWFQRFQLT